MNKDRAPELSHTHTHTQTHFHTMELSCEMVRQGRSPPTAKQSGLCLSHVSPSVLLPFHPLNICFKLDWLWIPVSLMRSKNFYGDFNWKLERQSVLFASVCECLDKNVRYSLPNRALCTSRRKHVQRRKISCRKREIRRSTRDRTILNNTVP